MPSPPEIIQVPYFLGITINLLNLLVDSRCLQGGSGFNTKSNTLSLKDGAPPLDSNLKLNSNNYRASASSVGKNINSNTSLSSLLSSRSSANYTKPTGGTNNNSLSPNSSTGGSVLSGASSKPTGSNPSSGGNSKPNPTGGSIFSSSKETPKSVIDKDFFDKHVGNSQPQPKPAEAQQPQPQPQQPQGKGKGGGGKGKGQQPTPADGQTQPKVANAYGLDPDKATPQEIAKMEAEAKKRIAADKKRRQEEHKQRQLDDKKRKQGEKNDQQNPNPQSTETQPTAPTQTQPAEGQQPQPTTQSTQPVEGQADANTNQADSGQQEGSWLGNKWKNSGILGKTGMVGAGALGAYTAYQGLSSLMGGGRRKKRDDE